MDMRTLAADLQLALSTNPEERKAAEERLNQYQHVPGHLVGLLQIIMKTNVVDISVRQVASIHFKNSIARHWTPREPGYQHKITDTDKVAVCKNLLEAILHAPPIIRVHLGDGLKTIIHDDYPEPWHSLLRSIDANLGSHDQQCIYSTLYALRILTRQYDISTYQLLKPQLDDVVFDIVFPLMCFNDTDDKLWREDPHEYVRKSYDIIEDMYSPHTAAINFISELVRKRGKENLQKFWAFVVVVFRSYDENQKHHREKDGGLLAVGALSDKLKQTEPYKSQLEQVLVQHVYPEFNSPVGHLRAKAAWVSGQYANVTFADQRNFSTAMHSVVAAALKDPELPVRVDSFVALRSFVEACKGTDLNKLRRILPRLLDEFFKLMNEVVNGGLVFTLETIVDKFREEMVPYALDLCQNLAEVFRKCLKLSETDEVEDYSGALAAAVGCLRAISTILKSVSRLPDLFPEMEPTLLPIMQRMWTTNGQGVFEVVLEIVSYMTYFSPTISLNMWSLWPLMVSAMVKGWAILFFKDILVPLDNYISRSTEHFLTCKDPDYQESLFKMISLLMADQSLEDSDIESAPKLIEAVLQNCKGRVDEWVEPYLRVSMERLGRTNKNYMKDLLIEVVANAFYYNAGLALNILQKMGATAEVFHAWFQMLYETKKSGQPVHFRKKHDKKVCILGLASLLSLPAEQMPQELQSVLDQVFRAELKLLVAYQEQLAESAKKGDDTEDDGELEGLISDKDDEWDKDIGEDDEDGDEVDIHTHQAAQASAFYKWAEDEDDKDDEFTDDEEFQAPIDNVDPFILFADVMKAMAASDPARFQALSQAQDFENTTLTLCWHSDASASSFAQ